MAIYVGPISQHSANAARPPGVIGTSWGYMTSDASLLDLQSFLTINSVAIGIPVGGIRTPVLGAHATYVAVSATTRAAAIAAGGIDASGRLVFAKAFDAPASRIGTWDS